MVNAKVIAICKSDIKGTSKVCIPEAEFVEDWGIRNDAHAGNWHRQISLLSKEKIDLFNEKGANVKYGAFGENIVLQGYDLKTLPIGSIIEIGDSVVLRVTQIGKQCHSGCDIAQRMGECIMPNNGIFARVLNGGKVSINDEIRIFENHRVSIITLSDKAYNKQRIDTSSEVIKKIMLEKNYEIVSKIILPDEKEPLENLLIKICDSKKADLILTTGGTGLSQRDITTEATKQVITKEVPGLSEAIRYQTMKYTSKAMLTRGVSGIRGNTLIVNLSGSPIAVEEQLNSIIDVLKHGLDTLNGISNECARTKEN